MNTKSVTLYYQEGSSDKVYQAHLRQEPTGWTVEFAYGRRGTALVTGTKTQTPVLYAKAKYIYDKLVKDKLAKGYTPGEEGIRYQGTPKEAANTGITPQLLNPLDSDELDEFLSNDNFVMQEKFDGRRILILANKDGEIKGINRNGLEVSLPKHIAETAANLKLDFLIDGELLGDQYVAFDCLNIGQHDLRPDKYLDRLDALWNLTESTEPQISLVTTHVADRKRYALAELLDTGKEGVVFKDKNAPYTPGRPASGGTQRKYKFYTTASFVVASHNQQRSVELSLYNQGELRLAGNVTIPPNKEIPVIGQVVEIRYLYAFKESGSVYQPTYLNPRDDVKPLDCTTAQLKFKS